MVPIAVAFSIAVTKLSSVHSPFEVAACARSKVSIIAELSKDSTHLADALQRLHLVTNEDPNMVARRARETLDDHTPGEGGDLGEDPLALGVELGVAKGGIIEEADERNNGCDEIVV